jgi:hypothetical protein
LLTTPGFSHFSSAGFSTYPRTKTTVLSSPGARSTASWCEPIGDQPLATELRDLPSATACGSPKPFHGPKKLSRSVSNPATGAFTE